VEGFASNAQRNPKGKFQRMNHAVPPHLPSNRRVGWTFAAIFLLPEED